MLTKEGPAAVFIYLSMLIKSALKRHIVRRKIKPTLLVLRSTAARYGSLFQNLRTACCALKTEAGGSQTTASFL